MKRDFVDVAIDFRVIFNDNHNFYIAKMCVIRTFLMPINTFQMEVGDFCRGEMGSEQFDQRIFDFSFSNYKEIDYNKDRAEQAYSHLQQSICCQESFLISTSYQL